MNQKQKALGELDTASTPQQNGWTLDSCDEAEAEAGNITDSDALETASTERDVGTSDICYEAEVANITDSNELESGNCKHSRARF